jgi:hypothetical protein
MAMPSSLLPFYEHLCHSLPECEIRYLSKDFDRHKSFGILNPANGRTFKVSLDNTDVAQGRQPLFDHQIKEIRSFLFTEEAG